MTFDSGCSSGPVSMRFPVASVTAAFEKAASTPSVNLRVSEEGGEPTVDPTRGSACSRKAWPCAAGASRSDSAATAAARSRRGVMTRPSPAWAWAVASRRSAAIASGEDVVDEEVDDEDDAPVELVVGRLVEREASGDAQLDPAVHVDEARRDEDLRPPLLLAVHAVLEVELGVADEIAERPGQAEVVHRLLEVRDAVLDRDVVGER